MKSLRLFLSVSALALFLSFAAYAQPKHSMAVRYNWYNYITPLENLPGEEDDEFMDIYNEANAPGIEVSYYNRILQNTFLAVPVKVGAARTGRTLSGEIDDSRDVIGNLDVLLQHNFFAEGAVSPYVHAGVGSAFNFDEEVFDLNIPLGVGVNFRLAKNLYLSGQTQYRIAPADEDLAKRKGLDNWQHAAGFHLFFGADEEVIVPPPPPLPLDGDGDGIADESDRCPTIAGLPTNAGCPDTDGDGVVDLDDLCPNEKGVGILKGCPDGDRDGVADRDDRCPTEAGPASNNGCPVKVADRDNDGVPDDRDACPDVAGLAALGGCPDADRDGVADRDDRCPNEAGPRSNNGCPEIKKEDKARLDEIVKNIQFNTGKSTLTTASFAIMDEVTSVMKKYPSYSAAIEGHTDSSGDDASNMRLSESRAKTCYDYLISKGIAANRLSYKGYGETRPIADNTTEAGRAKNRRVVFDLK
jgi:outer membrane protein OmpA-like peptidoglycan-associated protein